VPCNNIGTQIGVAGLSAGIGIGIRNVLGPDGSLSAGVLTKARFPVRLFLPRVQGKPCRVMGKARVGYGARVRHSSSRSEGRKAPSPSTRLRAHPLRNLLVPVMHLLIRMARLENKPFGTIRANQLERHRHAINKATRN